MGVGSGGGDVSRLVLGEILFFAVKCKHIAKNF